MNKQSNQELPRLVTFTPQAAAAVAPQQEPPISVVAPVVTHTREVLEQIRTRAYLLWVERCQREDTAGQDWRDAEAEILAG